MKLSLKNLSFERNEKFILHNVNLELGAGELLHVQGANGSGKSTLLRILSGLIEPTTGHVLWQDKCISQQLNEYQQKLHYVGHRNGIKSNLTVLENLHLSSTLLVEKSKQPELLVILKKMGLSLLANTEARYLSAGQSRRLALARLTFNDSPLWILDEPMTALDMNGQLVLMQLLNQHLTKGGIAIVATHQTLSVAHPVKMISLEELS